MVSTLVTGGAGFIGSHLARRLLDLGHQVLVVDDLSSGQRSNVPPGASFLQHDLSQQLDWPEGLFQFIFHFAGQSSGEKSFLDPARDLDANTRSTLLMAQLARQHQAHLVVASSMAVYGDRPGAHSESDPTEPISFYGWSKLHAEQALRCYPDLSATVLRLFNVYGPGQDLAERRQGMVSIYLSFLLAREPLLIKGSLERTRDFVFVDDVVEAAVGLALARRPGIFNVGTGIATSVKDLVSALLKATELPPDYPIVEAPSTPGDILHSCARVEALQEAIDWRPGVGLEEGLRRMVG